ncbi:MAG: response regulator transcription factor [Firmicutes bacterium]|jgi:two-component system response regulator LytT|nr:response regulator transcription factor [Bacillota bacterium]NBI61989.1 DNA-binding response regulator [Clostridiales bacterium]
MLFCAICEDEPYFAQELKAMAEGYLRERALEAEIEMFSSGEELLEAKRAPDIVLMDIRLPGKNGMETAERLRNAGYGSQVIFITSYKEYVFHAFDLDAVHYLMKPVKKEKLYLAMDKAVMRMGGGEKRILITKGDAAFPVRLRDILYCEVFDHQVFIHTRTESFQISGTLEAFEKRLDSRFFRCHRSYLVNMNAVREKREGQAVVAGGRKVLISRRKQQEFMARLLQACRKGED